MRRLLFVFAAILVLVGVLLSAKAARHRAPRSRTMEATAYCLRGVTASGGTVHRGTVAADPRVLPGGSRIRIRGDGITGTYTVEDEGAAMKGRRIDIYMPSCQQAKRFGRQRVVVTIERIGVPVPPAR